MVNQAVSGEEENRYSQTQQSLGLWIPHLQWSSKKTGHPQLLLTSACTLRVTPLGQWVDPMQVEPSSRLAPAGRFPSEPMVEFTKQISDMTITTSC